VSIKGPTHRRLPQREVRRTRAALNAAGSFAEERQIVPTIVTRTRKTAWEAQISPVDALEVPWSDQEVRGNARARKAMFTTPMK